jgi:hypothetical protein
MAVMGRWEFTKLFFSTIRIHCDLSRSMIVVVVEEME